MNIGVKNWDFLGNDPIAVEWARQLGAKDGTVLAHRVLDELDDADTQEQVDGVTTGVVAAVRELAAIYRDRGVSDGLIRTWRAACHDEMSRVFREAREIPEEAEDSIAPGDELVEDDSFLFDAVRVPAEAS